MPADAARGAFTGLRLGPRQLPIECRGRPGPQVSRHGARRKAAQRVPCVLVLPVDRATGGAGVEVGSEVLRVAARERRQQARRR